MNASNAAWNAPLAAAIAAAGTLLLWRIAAGAASRRRLDIGELPAAVPAAVAVVAVVAATMGVPLSGVTAGAGATVAAIVDARTGSIFDPVTAALLTGALAMAMAEGRIHDALFGCAAIAGGLLGLYLVSAGRGLGLGDVKLGAGVGAALGISAGVTAIGFAFIFGGIYGGWLLITKRAACGARVRFGPFIAAGTCVALLAPAGHLP